MKIKRGLESTSFDSTRREGESKISTKAEQRENNLIILY